MAHVDLDLTPTTAGYELAGTTVDPLQRVRNRFVVQFLSTTEDTRGSIFMSEMLAGRLKTNADVVSIFALASAQIIAAMREFALDLAPTRTLLLDFTVFDLKRIWLRFRVFTEEGTIEDNILVTA